MSKKKKNLDTLMQEAIVRVEEQPTSLPENWIWSKLEYLTDSAPYSLVDGPFGSNLKTVDYTTEGVRLIQLQNIGDGYWKDQNQKFISEEKAKELERCITYPDDIVIAKMAAPIARATIVPKVEEKYIVVADCIKLTSNKKLNIKYLVHCINSPIVRQVAESLGKGSTRKRINLKDVKKLPIPLPPLNEQKRIAEKVERLLNKIEEAKQLIEEAKETFELRRAAILDKAFRGELTAKWREKNLEIESGVMRLEKIKNERFQIVESKRELSEIAIMFDELNTEECIDNNNWLYLKANMFCYNINCGGTPSKDITEEGEIPFLKVYNIVKNKISFSYKPQYIPKEVHESKLKKSILKPNDVIMNIVGPPLKKIAIIPEEYPEMNMNQAIVRFRSTKYVLPKYLYFCLQYDETLKEVINETRGVVGQSNISVSQSRNLIMPIPSLEEQAVIVNKLEELIEREEVVLNLISDKKNLEELKQSILSKAFRGELGTNDPSEENAIELLKEVLQEQVK
ncbi:restriction endonuclease subunit S [Bacillus sp. CD3-5]|uniref:restriction endonuclease subunit S n=1 Tax=Bacillus sp. CD3-5 TaxID=2587157 RepID=UPI00111E5462|nr:restriction endonuclease subunit S [Bacillus sp. CD3-5]TNP25922.1 hypothetical protein FH036_10280 [Bacillus sp. CD3-5]